MEAHQSIYSHDEANEDDEQSTCDLATICPETFEKLIVCDSHQASASMRRRVCLLFQQRGRRKSVLTLSDLRDDFEQFRVWAKNLGVFATDNLSLDFRLREAADVRSSIVSLLRGNAIDLADCKLFQTSRFMIDHSQATSSSLKIDAMTLTRVQIALTQTVARAPAQHGACHCPQGQHSVSCRLVCRLLPMPSISCLNWL